MPYIIVTTLGKSVLYLEKVTKTKTIWSPTRSNARRYTRKEMTRKLSRTKKRHKGEWKTYSIEV